MARRSNKRSLTAGRGATRLGKLGKLPASKGTRNAGQVLVPSGSYRAKNFPALERLKQTWE